MEIDYRRAGEAREVREEDEEVVLRTRIKKEKVGGQVPIYSDCEMAKGAPFYQGHGERRETLKVNVREYESRGKRSRNGGSLHSVYAQHCVEKRRQAGRYTEGRKGYRQTDRQTVGESKEGRSGQDVHRKQKWPARASLIDPKKKKKCRFDQGQNQMPPFFSLSLLRSWPRRIIMRMISAEHLVLDSLSLSFSLSLFLSYRQTDRWGDTDA